MNGLSKINTLAVPPNANVGIVMMRLLQSGNEFTLDIRLTDGTVIQRFAVTHVINDGLVGNKDGHFGFTIIPFHAILEMEII